MNGLVDIVDSYDAEGLTLAGSLWFRALAIGVGFGHWGGLWPLGWALAIGVGWDHTRPYRACVVLTSLVHRMGPLVPGGPRRGRSGSHVGSFHSAPCVVRLKMPQNSLFPTLWAGLWHSPSCLRCNTGVWARSIRFTVLLENTLT